MVTKSAAGILLAGLCAAAIAVGVAVQDDDPQKKSDLEKFEAFLLDDSGRIEIAGTIEDPDGNPLDDVVVAVAETDPLDMSGTLSKRKESTFNHRFRINRRGVSSIDCIFSKEGYYSERRSFSFSNAASDSHENVLSKRNLVIALRKIPEPAPLEKYEGFPRSDISGPVSVLYTRKLPLSDTPLTAVQIKDRKRLNLARPHIFLDPEIDNEGRLSRVLFDIKQVGGMQTVLRMGRIGLSQPDAGDGFLDANISESIYRVDRGFRKMITAPPSGYQSRLVISVESGEENRFFYCRIHGEYGKGVVTNIAGIFTNDAGVEYAGVKIVLFLNLTGSRDVSYVHF